MQGEQRTWGMGVVHTHASSTEEEASTEAIACKAVGCVESEDRVGKGRSMAISQVRPWDPQIDQSL